MGRSKARRGRPIKHHGARTNSCGKILYNSREAAIAAAELQGYKHGTQLRPYRCHCTGWHLTSKV